MSDAVQITERHLGKIQIFLKPGDQIRGSSFLAHFKPKQLYRELINLAKQDGLMNASVYQTHSSFSIYEPIQNSHPELANATLAICIELIDEKPKLEAFCIKHAAYLQGKLVIFKAVEHWIIQQK